MSWTSLGLSLETSALRPDHDRQLRARWQTPDLGLVALEVHCVPSQLPPRPQSEPETIEVSNAGVAVWKTESELWLGDHLHLALGGGAACLTASSEESPPEAAWLLALVELQRLSGWLPLHAATVGRGEQAVSITGVSGAGKSTAALRLAGAGYTVLAEDQTWVHPATAGVTGLDRSLRTYADSLDRFAPHLRPQVQGVDAYGKLMLPLTPPAGAAQLSALLVFGLPEKATAAEKVRAVWECSGVPLLPRTRQGSAQAISALLRQIAIEGTTREEIMTQVDRKLRWPEVSCPED